MNTREIRTKKQKIFVYILVLIPFIAFVSVMIGPLANSVYYSLTKWKGVGSPKFIGFANYIQIGLTYFTSQYMKSYTLLLSGLAMATFPVLVIYLFFYNQIMHGMMAGAVKG